MDSNSTTRHPDPAWTSPARRWLRANTLVHEGQRPSPRVDDAWVRAATRLLSLTAEGPAKGCKPARWPHPAVAAAVALSREEPPHRRWAVEAWLLTDEWVDTIAEKTGSTPQAVEGYHALFFDVTTHMEARDWVMAEAVGAFIGEGFAGKPLGALWKYAAVSGGPRVLEAIIAVTTDKALPEWLRASFAEMDDPAYQEARFRLAAKLSVAIMRADSPAELGPLIEAHQQLRRMDREALGKVEEPDGLLPAVEALLKASAQHKKGQRRPGGEPSKAAKQTANPDGEEKGGWRATIDSLLESQK